MFTNFSYRLFYLTFQYSFLIKSNQIFFLSEIVVDFTDIDHLLANVSLCLSYGGDPLSHLPIGQESMEMRQISSSIAPALKGFIINRFI